MSKHFKICENHICLGLRRSLPTGTEVQNLSDDGDKTVEWDGQHLVGWVAINGTPTKVRATREMIHAHAAGFNDAIEREINQYRAEIFKRLTPLLIELNSK
jgi:hypothetical protein